MRFRILLSVVLIAAGRDSITPVDPAYKSRGTFEFTGKINNVAFELTRK